jgi:hypothetical protein
MCNISWSKTVSASSCWPTARDECAITQVLLHEGYSNGHDSGIRVSLFFYGKSPIAGIVREFDPEANVDRPS